LAAYAAGHAFRFETGSAANSSAVTLNVNILGAVAVNKGDGTTALAAGDMPASAMVTVVHDGTRFRLVDPATNDALVQAWVDLASATTTDLSTVGANVRITGTTTITGFGTAASGVTRKLRFAAALTLTHNATSLILPGAADITTAAGDTAEAISLGSGNWVLVNFTRAAAGYAGNILLANPVAAANIGINRATEVATTSGTAIDFTGIPAGVRRITVMFDGVSFNGSDGASIQLGDSGGIETTGYSGVTGISVGASTGAGTGNSTGVKVIYDGTAASDNCSGVVTIVNQSGNKWLLSGLVSRNNGSLQVYTIVGSKTLSDVLDRLRFKIDGASSFDAGTINIMWEF
jgi:hypothetical protein